MTVLLSKKATAARVSLHPASIMRLAAKGRFPQPVKIGAMAQGIGGLLQSCRVAFVEAEVEKWIADRIRERDAAPARGSVALNKDESRVSPLRP